MPDQPEFLTRLEKALFGAAPAYTRHEVAERSGVPLERAERLWRALGFPTVGDDDRIFAEHDVDALRTMAAVVDQGVFPAEAEATVARALGQAMARLADWQTSVLLGDVELGGESDPGHDEAIKQARDLVPVIDELQSYVWRRHLVAAAARAVPVASGSPDSSTVVVGFADIVGFTAMSRSLSEGDLATMIERFEARGSALIAEHGGRVVKTIGDEVMFVVPDPAKAARLALALLEWGGDDADDAPDLRVGMASGQVLSALGDVYGPVVNVASRLTSVARPGTVVVDRDLADRLEDDESVTLRRIRRVSVRGYSRLEPWVLRPRRESSH